MGSLKNDIDNYLESHKVVELLRHLSEMVFFFKPEDPVYFMAKTVLEIQRASDAEHGVPSLYSEDSLRAYFRLLDPVGVGMISWDQLRSAFEVLGFGDLQVSAVKDMPVFEDTFVNMGMKYVSKRLKIDMGSETNGVIESIPGEKNGM